MQKLQYAAIGAGGRGAADINSLTGRQRVHLIAAADVDAGVLPKLTAKHPDLKTFSDWRDMLAKRHREFDIVSVSTPDHMHGIQSISAMNFGKHVYVQKPLAQNIGECRAVQEAAHRNQVVLQMGTQGASSLHDRLGVDLIQRQMIGKVSEAWVFCGKSWGDTKPRPNHEDPVPAELDWDGWLGVGQRLPYIDNYYHPKNWRRRQEFGSGTLGDMGCHIFNAMYRGLGLTSPHRVRSEKAVPNSYNWTSNERVEYRFPGTQFTDGELKVHWVSGRERAPKELIALIPKGVKYRFGCLLKGSDGVLLLRHGNSPILLPQEKFSDLPSRSFEPISHHQAFIDAIIDGKTDRLMSPVDYSVSLTEFILLGNIAMQHSRRWLEWDSAQTKVTNHEPANRHIHRTYRSGWAIMNA